MLHLDPHDHRILRNNWWDLNPIITNIMHVMILLIISIEKKNHTCILNILFTSCITICRSSIRLRVFLVAHMDTIGGDTVGGAGKLSN